MVSFDYLIKLQSHCFIIISLEAINESKKMFLQNSEFGKIYPLSILDL